MRLGTIIKRVYFTCIRKKWHSVVPEDVKACVLLQRFCQTSSTMRSNAIGGETKQQSNNRSQMDHSLFDNKIYFMELNSSVDVDSPEVGQAGVILQSLCKRICPLVTDGVTPHSTTNFNFTTFTIVFVSFL